MINPIIKLTGTNGRTIRININHIVTYDQREYEYSGKNNPPYYTYIVLNGGNAITRSVIETPDDIDELIAKQTSSVISVCDIGR